MKKNIRRTRIENEFTIELPVINSYLKNRFSTPKTKEDEKVLQLRKNNNNI